MVNKLVLGSAQFGLAYGISNKRGKTSLEEVKSILNYCSEIGISTIDTASAYGEAENVLGKSDLSSFQIISKFLANENKAAFEAQLSSTLKDLAVDHLYGYLAHRPEQLIANPWEWDLLKEKRISGVVKKIGFSLNFPAELYRLLDKGFVPDLVQVPFNYLDRRFEDALIELKKQQIEVHSRSSFLQGLFFMDVESLSIHFNPIKTILAELHRSTNNLQGSLLKFVLERPFIDKTVIGVESLGQLKENIEGFGIATELSLEVGIVSEHILMPMHWPTNN